MDITIKLMEGMILFIIILPLIAFLYASVGHGGASGYIALMALFSLPITTMKQTALILNLFVAGITFYQFYKAGHFKINLLTWFIIGSIPAAYLGGNISVDPFWYKKILGFFLVIAILRMLLIPKVSNESKTLIPYLAILIGIIIGFLSGLIGIGGGIILSPVILLLGWATIKQTAAISAAFIWLNSSAALLGQFNSGVHLVSDSLIFIALALVGGYFGSYYGAKKLSKKKMSYLLIVVLGAASFKLLM